MLELSFVSRFFAFVYTSGESVTFKFQWPNGTWVGPSRFVNGQQQRGNGQCLT